MGSLGVDCSKKRGSLGVRFTSKTRGSIDRDMISAHIWWFPQPDKSKIGSKFPATVPQPVTSSVDSYELYYRPSDSVK